MTLKVKNVLTTVPKHKGVATVVRVVEVAGEQYLDIRDLISTPGEVVEGRGYLFPLNDNTFGQVMLIANALDDALEVT